MMLLAALLVPAVAFNFGAKPTPKKTTASDGLVSTPDRWKPAFGEGAFAALEARRAGRIVKDETTKDALVPTPLKFQFAFGKPEALAARRAERLAKWEWSDSFLARARPDLNNYGAGLYFDDGLTILERKQIADGKEAYLTGGAKLRLKVLRGEI
ncbi:hypothetical protein CTAYLR_001156 [Chrysophaeum taylorii]|uniref:Uncharacterized protein n=1 Tax=Chrysophaeum taylorii TaxID=2483200 RepID=A0AAD7XQQ3_9STRA|nr:hypothetical protein CTAYLR_001156 [Chrysophaeum taylorii]